MEHGSSYDLGRLRIAHGMGHERSGKECDACDALVLAGTLEIEVNRLRILVRTNELALGNAIHFRDQYAAELEQLRLVENAALRIRNEIHRNALWSPAFEAHSGGALADFDKLEPRG